MDTKINYRKERIERLLQELNYEITRGMMEGEVEESLTYTFVVPVSKTFRKGIVACEFVTRPTPYAYAVMQSEPRLRVVK